MKRDVLSIIEAAYNPAPDVDTWLGRLTETANAALDQGSGVFGHAYALSNQGGVSVTGRIHASKGPLPGLAAEGHRIIAALGESREAKAIFAKTYTRAPVAGTFSELTGRREKLSSLVSSWMTARVSDAFGIVGGNPDGRGVVIHAMSFARSRLTSPERALWVHVAAHLASAYRLVQRPRAEVDAVLLPDGRVQHATARANGGGTLTALREETRAIDRVRGRLRRANPEEALALWKGLVAGQWSLVDHVDTDGRRYVLAKRNTPEARPWHDLTERERQVVAYAAEGEPLKIIAYALGVSVHRVSVHLSSAARKVGARTRVELVREYRAAMTAARGEGPRLRHAVEPTS